jgi:hypothetical protein
MFKTQISECLTTPKSRRIEFSLRNDVDGNQLRVKFWNDAADQFQNGNFTTGQRVQLVNLWTSTFQGKTTCNSNELTEIMAMMGFLSALSKLIV